MRIKIAAVDDHNKAGPWKIIYTRDGSRMHNHPALLDVRVHAAHRRRATKVKTPSKITNVNDLIFIQTVAGVPVSKIYATLLLSDTNTLVIPKDIANAKDAKRRDLLATKTAIEALFGKLEEHGFQYKYEVEPNSRRLKYLLWAHPQTMDLARHYMDVVVLDCTYKTNKHNWPLCNVVILTGLNKVLPLAQCWLPGEAEPNYTWAFSALKAILIENDVSLPRLFATDRHLACMNAIEVVYPDIPKIVCRWHINRNVLARVEDDLETIRLSQPGPNGETKPNIVQTDIFMTKFHETVASETEAEFEQHCSALRTLSSVTADYLDRTWWKYKTKIVTCWTDRYAHFGCHDTSTVEGTHSKIKRWLESSKGDLLAVFLKLLPWWIASANAISYQSAQDATIPPHRLRYDQYFAVVRLITTHALTETDHLWKMARKIVTSGAARTECTGVFRRTHGRQCLHQLIEIYESNGHLKILPEHFDRHWWILSNDIRLTNRVLEPANLSNKRGSSKQQKQHKAGHGASSTRRDPSWFERDDRLVDNHLPVFSFHAPLEDDNDGSFNDAYLPPRVWGYAGLS